MRTDPEGSQWRRWDLHFHTPASFDYANRSLTPTNLADYLLAANVSVVAVTDHHVLDVSFISGMRKAAGSSLTVLPGIELRSELGGSESVHFIGIFSESINLEDLWRELQVRMEISSSQVSQKGNERIWVPFEHGCQVIRSLGGIVTVHAGKKQNSIEKLTNADIVKQAVKTDLLKKLIDIYEVGQITDCPAYEEIVFPIVGKCPPLILCSDNHDASKYAVKAPLWIKADPSFLGLLHVLQEPQSRVFLGDEPGSFERVRQNGTKYISSLNFDRVATDHPDEIWFSGDIPLNTGLVAVIGNKGSGKSALADVLGLLGNTHNSDFFSFLNSERFCNSRNGMAREFKASIQFASGTTLSARLDASTFQDRAEAIKYIPQGFLEKVCTELKQKKGAETQFDSELKEVIFSHVGQAERLGCTTLDELIDYKSDESERRIQLIVNDLQVLNEEIVETERRMSAAYRATLAAELVKIQTELEAHEKAKPVGVAKPDMVPETQALTTEISSAIAASQRQAKDLELDIAHEQKKERDAAQIITTCDKLLAKFSNLERQFRAVLEEGGAEAVSLGLQIQDLVKLQIDRQPLDARKLAASTVLVGVKRSLNPEVESSLTSRLEMLIKDEKNLRLKLDEPNRVYQGYLKALAEWERKRGQLVGTTETQDSLKFAETRLASLETLPLLLTALEEKRDTLGQEIFENIEALLSEYRQFYGPVQHFIDTHPLAQEQVRLQFEATIIVENFADQFLDLINQGRRGSFYGQDEGRDVVSNLLSISDFQSKDGVLSFIRQVLERLRRDHRSAETAILSPSDQLKQDVRLTEVYNFLFSLDYLKPRYVLRWLNKDLDQLSPGERGNLLLVFYLLIDRRDVPLVIDQPEENLDNQTIASVLVPCMRYAKNRRQIVIVTHNPNLAVVCDADQVVYAELDKTAGNKIKYTSGAIENPELNRAIMNVLEGTKTAFDIRDAKYGIVDNRRSL